MRTPIVLAQVTNHKFLIHNARLPSQHHKGRNIRKVMGRGGGGGGGALILKNIHAMA